MDNEDIGKQFGKAMAKKKEADGNKIIDEMYPEGIDPLRRSYLIHRALFCCQITVTGGGKGPSKFGCNGSDEEHLPWKKFYDESKEKYG